MSLMKIIKVDDIIVYRPSGGHTYSSLSNSEVDRPQIVIHIVPGWKIFTKFLDTGDLNDFGIDSVYAGHCVRSFYPNTMIRHSDFSNFKFV